ncbi:MAG: aryl-alcohol dehydrogenase-like predicted oxidoreductase [Verrucomicrobiales bacterium]|jgi:aryl-alcohol dehydrogenase-like predicted oxidoreductase
MGLSSNYTETDDDAAISTVHRAIDLGVTHFDTADAYAAGHNERVVGAALKGRRDEVTIATKFGQLTEDGKQIVRATPDYVKSACDASLERLGIDTIDLYYAHRIDPDVPVEETVGAMSELIDAGKVRWLGLSEAAPETVRRGHATHPLAAVQAEFSLWTRFAEDEHFDVCEELDIAFVAYAPLGRGFLSGTIKSAGDLREGDRRQAHPRFSAENIDSNIKMIDTLNDVAVEVGASPAQVAIAWVLARRPFLHSIPGTTSISHLEENLASSEVTLTDEQVSRLARSFDTVAGDRYPAGAMKKLQL